MPKIKVTDIDADASTSAKGIVQLTGCLGGAATSPTVVAIKESGGTTLTLGSLGTGQFLKSTGSSIVGSNDLFLNSSGTSEPSVTSNGSYGGIVSVISVTKPTNVINDDVLLIFFACRLNSGSPSVSGFTQHIYVNNAPSHIWLFYKKITNAGSEPSSYSVTGFNGDCAVACVKIRNCDSASLIDGYSTTTVDGSTVTAPAYTALTENTRVFQFLCQAINGSNNPYSPVFSSTALWSYSSGVYFPIRTCLYSFTQGAASAVSPLNTFSANTGQTHDSTGFTICIRSTSFSSLDLLKSSSFVPAANTDSVRIYHTDERAILVKDESSVVRTLGHPVKYKTADETVNSSTALQDDDHLTFAVAANEIWEFDIDAPVTVGVGGIKVSVNAPASPTGFTADMQILDGTTTVAMSRITTADTALENAGALTTGRVKIHGVIENGANAGNVLLRFAQQASDAAATTVKKYSTITYRKIG